MSIISATSTNISISTFIRGFHPDFPNSGDTDISADTWGNAAMYPLPTTIGSPASQIQWSELRNKKWFQQNIIVSGGTGTISVVTPSTQALYDYNAGYSATSAMVDRTLYSTFTWRATATYPNYVAGFYTGAGQSGALVTASDPNLGTGGVHTLDYTVTAVTETAATLYVHFVDAHA